MSMVYNLKNRKKKKRIINSMDRIIGMRKLTKSFEAKEEYLISNGAILLEKQISLFQGKGMGSEPLKVFSAKDIQQATNNYDGHLILGRKLATVYKGILNDREVAIKTPQGLYPTEKMIDFFLNQVTIKQVISHKNVLRLYGCCLETPIPILVYEFTSNGVLFDHLHENSNTNPSYLPWPDRVRIASETSYALSYMHLGIRRPIVHLDVKSSNIFLDEFFTAKLSNFGYSVSISPEESFQSWTVLGSFGYLDPEYQETLLVTEKCDVYSFGIVLVELITGNDPADMLLKGNNLADNFVSSMQRNCLLQIVDSRILKEGSNEEFQALAELALKCIQNHGDDRPTMKEVASELRQMHHLVRSQQKL